ncbi:alpha/beta fold hydrolase [Pantoea sp. 18069]|uniref:alpha/beta fold hydrolase n=1 Tax=Pantoea sp. 18069 TaxID=2681415 RepID=UPI00135A3043|nr:alpha/beta hydrolase [Pantoea sp. 18069]
MTQYLQHGRIRLALHCLQPAQSPGSHALLLLHGLGESARAHPRSLYGAWPGAVHALDFTGHGASSIPAGGGYSCEVLMGDVDIALAHLGAATVCGRGLGAYIALLIAGARPPKVRGAVLLDGPGLAGSCATASPYIPQVHAAAAVTPDPFAMAELATDARPPEYAAHYAMLAQEFSAQANPITICTRERPPWLQAVRVLLACDAAHPVKACMSYAVLPTAAAVP